MSDASFLWHLIITVRLKHRGGCMKITVLMNGPYIVTGRVPLITSEICKDEDGKRLIWREVKRYPVQEQCALCRCGHSDNKVFCDGTHEFTLMESRLGTMSLISKVRKLSLDLC